MPRRSRDVLLHREGAPIQQLSLTRVKGKGVKIPAIIDQIVQEHRKDVGAKPAPAPVPARAPAHVEEAVYENPDAPVAAKVSVVT